MHTYDLGKSHIFLYIHNTCEKAVNMIKYKIFPSDICRVESCKVNCMHNAGLLQSYVCIYIHTHSCICIN